MSSGARSTEGALQSLSTRLSPPPPPQAWPSTKREAQRMKEARRPKNIVKRKEQRHRAKERKLEASRQARRDAEIGQLIEDVLVFAVEKYSTVPCTGDRAQEVPAALMIQWGWRTKMVRKRYVERKLETSRQSRRDAEIGQVVEAVIAFAVEKYYDVSCARDRAQEVSAALMIQWAWRTKMVRTRYVERKLEASRQGTRDAEIEPLVEVVIVFAVEKCSAVPCAGGRAQEIRAVLTIQRAWRTKMVRKRYAERKLEVSRQATRDPEIGQLVEVVIVFVVEKRSDVPCARDRTQEVPAAFMIQWAWRTKMIRKHYVERKLEASRQAKRDAEIGQLVEDVIVPAVENCSDARCAKDRTQDVPAVLTIQLAWRTKTIRTRYVERKLEASRQARRDAEIRQLVEDVIAFAVEKYSAVSCAGDRAQEIRAALIIQWAWRTKMVRTRYAERKLEVSKQARRDAEIGQLVEDVIVFFVKNCSDARCAKGRTQDAPAALIIQLAWRTKITRTRYVEKNLEASRQARRDAEIGQLVEGVIAFAVETCSTVPCAGDRAQEIRAALMLQWTWRTSLVRKRYAERKLEASRQARRDAEIGQLVEEGIVFAVEKRSEVPCARDRAQEVPAALMIRWVWRTSLVRTCYVEKKLEASRQARRDAEIGQLVEGVIALAVEKCSTVPCAGDRAQETRAALMLQWTWRTSLVRKRYAERKLEASRQARRDAEIGQLVEDGIVFAVKKRSEVPCARDRTQEVPAAFMIQWVWRTSLVRKRYVERKLEASRQATRVAEIGQLVDDIILFTVEKCSAVPCAGGHAQEVPAVLTIQRAWRTKMIRTRYVERELEVSRQATRNAEIGQLVEVVIVLAVEKRYGVPCARDRTQKIPAALIIQWAWRTKMIRKHYVERKLEASRQARRDAEIGQLVEDVVAFAVEKCSAVPCAGDCAQEVPAALMIQWAWRTKIVRKRYAERKLEASRQARRDAKIGQLVEHVIVLAVEKCYDTSCARDRTQEIRAALMIQWVWRTKMVRKHYARTCALKVAEKRRQRLAVRSIETVWKQVHERKSRAYNISRVNEKIASHRRKKAALIKAVAEVEGAGVTEKLNDGLVSKHSAAIVGLEKETEPPGAAVEVSETKSAAALISAAGVAGRASRRLGDVLLNTTRISRRRQEEQAAVRAAEKSEVRVEMEAHLAAMEEEQAEADEAQAVEQVALEQNFLREVFQRLRCHYTEACKTKGATSFEKTLLREVFQGLRCHYIQIRETKDARLAKIHPRLHLPPARKDATGSTENLVPHLLQPLEGKEIAAVFPARARCLGGHGSAAGLVAADGGGARVGRWGTACG